MTKRETSGFETESRHNLWRENFRQATDVIRLHRMRSGLLILGVAIGITTILMMVTVLSGLSRKIETDLVSARRPYVYVQRFDLIVTGDNEEEMMRRKPLTAGDADLCPLEKELELSRTYLEIEKMRFGERLQLRYLSPTS